MGSRGRAVADGLIGFGIRYVAIEADDRRLREAIADGYNVLFGSVNDPHLWQPVAVEGRKLNILTEPQFEASAELMPVIRDRYPALPLIVAVADEAEAAQFRNIGVRPVIDAPDDGVVLASEVLVELGVDREAAMNWAFKRRQKSPHDATQTAAE
jgi:CPA2 family monovalent cation:H+ antiporter-2